MYFGPFYFNTKELFLVILVILLAVAQYLNWQIVGLNKVTLLTLTILILFIKGLLPSIDNEAFFTNVLVTLILSFFVPAWQAVLFFLVTFGFFRMLRVI